MTISNKSLQTRENIKSSLLKLMEAQPFTSITIQDIVKEADLNRSSFYRYFDDKYAVVEEIENEIIDNLKNEAIGQVEELFAQTSKYEVLFYILNKFSKDTTRSSILLGENGDPSFVHKMTKSVKENFPTDVRQMEIPSKYDELANDLKASAVINFLAKFEAYNKKYTIEEIAYFFSLI
ncbi:MULTISPECIES: TetR/AcrR family transcriptional regulator [unclassified Aerococcus]|uniref:TetR/AcrR family transcriptional regulator n=1 Tax=unclassified Aerococcus TaxID=2618060 RepID=UPI0025B89725|nr:MULTISPECIES: TetR/AcrR family transcriptional regulator [unclassified Aerococcus]